MGAETLIVPAVLFSVGLAGFLAVKRFQLKPLFLALMFLSGIAFSMLSYASIAAAVKPIVAVVVMVAIAVVTLVLFRNYLGLAPVRKPMKLVKS